MQYQQLGNTGIFVSRLCLGAMTFGGSGAIWQMIGGLPQHDTNTLVDESIEAGINFFDTANVYSEGQSEIALGKALGTRRRDMVVATKVFSRMGEGPNEVGLSRSHIMHEAEASLQRLNTDYIDLYQIHGFDPLTPFDETLRALDDLVRQGKVRYIGCSNLTSWQVMKSLAISEKHNLEKFVTLQAYYSLAGRELEREIIPMLDDQKMGLLPWSPLAGGFLSGKFTRANQGANGDARRSKPLPPIDLDKTYTIIETLQAIATRKDATVAQAALGWLLHQKSVTSVIIGARSAAQLRDNLKSVDFKLDANELTKIDEVSRLSPEYPGWMQGMPSIRKPGEKRDWSQVAKASS